MTLKHRTDTKTLQAGGKLVLKSYDTRYESNYQNEINAYHALDNAKSCENILKYIGSYYVQPLAPGSGLQFTIMLEHAERGSLLQLYRENDPPVTLSETKAFWSSFLQVAKGLMVTHNTMPKRAGASWCVLSCAYACIRLTDELLQPVFTKISNHLMSSSLNVGMPLMRSLTWPLRSGILATAIRGNRRPMIQDDLAMIAGVRGLTVSRSLSTRSVVR